MRLLIMGAPGSGKGTQAARLASVIGIPAISTGDIFRANVAAESPLGRVAREYMDAGEYVPDQVTNAMVRDRLGHADCAVGFLLDGYPRTLQQVEELDAILDAGDQQLDGVVELVLDEQALVDRLLLRARDEGRTDDTPAVVRRRQEVYAEQTAPLLTEYAGRGLLYSIDADGSVEDVTARLTAALADIRTAVAGR